MCSNYSNNFAQTNHAQIKHCWWLLLVPLTLPQVMRGARNTKNVPSNISNLDDDICSIWSFHNQRIALVWNLLFACSGMSEISFELCWAVANCPRVAAGNQRISSIRSMTHRCNARVSPNIPHVHLVLTALERNKMKPSGIGLEWPGHYRLYAKKALRQVQVKWISIFSCSPHHEVPKGCSTLDTVIAYGLWRLKLIGLNIFETRRGQEHRFERGPASHAFPTTSR